MEPIVISEYVLEHCTRYWHFDLTGAGYVFQPITKQYTGQPTPEAKRLQARIALDFIETAVATRSKL